MTRGPLVSRDEAEDWFRRRHVEKERIIDIATDADRPIPTVQAWVRMIARERGIRLEPLWRSHPPHIVEALTESADLKECQARTGMAAEAIHKARYELREKGVAVRKWKAGGVRGRALRNGV